MTVLIRVWGQEGNARPMYREVSMQEFVRLWGPWAPRVFAASKRHPLRLEGRTVWSEIVR